MNIICLNCKENILPFQKDFDSQTNQMQTPMYDIKTFLKSINKTNNINNLGTKDNINNDNDTPIINCSYYDIESFNYGENKNVSLFHLNIASLHKHKEKFETALNCLDYNFDIMGISETKIEKGINPIFDINLKGYNYFNTPMEYHSDFILVYISNTLK